MTGTERTLPCRGARLPIQVATRPGAGAGVLLGLADRLRQRPRDGPAAREAGYLPARMLLARLHQPATRGGREMSSEDELNELNEIIADVREIFSEFNSEDVRVMARRASEELIRLRLMETATVQGLRRQVHDLERRLAYSESGPHGDCQG